MLLVAVDPAGCAYQVVEEASSLAAALSEPVILMTSVELPEGVTPEVHLETGRYAGHTAEDVLVTDARQALDALAEPLRSKGVGVRLEVRVGPCVQAVLDSADEHRPRMLVLGTHGRTGLKRFFLGSVAEQILRQAKVPVLTVRSQGVVDHPSDAQKAVQALADG